MTTIFIDGESGTTGLKLRERIANRADLKLISLPTDERRSPDARLEAMKAADVTVLCLPDDAAREAVKLADEAGTRVLDASSAHRTAPEWVYGMPELMNGRAAEIARAECRCRAATPQASSCLWLRLFPQASLRRTPSFRPHR